MRSSSEDKLSALEQHVSEVRIHLSARGCAVASPQANVSEVTESSTNKQHHLHAAYLEHRGTQSRELALSNRPAFRSVGHVL